MPENTAKRLKLQGFNTTHLIFFGVAASFAIFAYLESESNTIVEVKSTVESSGQANPFALGAVHRDEGGGSLVISPAIVSG